MSFLCNSSVVQWFERTEKQRCGYCKTQSSLSNGMWAEQLTVDDYQELIDRGWRRSGKYCYKPIMAETCCPLYTIKCDAAKFSLSKSQKKVIKRFSKYLKDGKLNAKENSAVSYTSDEPESCTPNPGEIPKIDLCKVSSEISNYIEATTNTSNDVLTCNTEDEFEKKGQYQKNTRKCDNINESSQKNAKTKTKDGEGADPNKPPCKKAKLVRLERKKEKALKKGLSLETTSAAQAPKTLQEFLAEVPEEYKNKLKIRVERMSAESNSFIASAEIYKKYQMTVHNDAPHKCCPEQFHNFLVETPLKPRNFPDGVEGVGYGSFHQQYWLNDKLIAVGVIDILPKCVSSVYFFYDPDYRSLTLGTYGSMREIQLTQQLQMSLPDLRNYYMGFYIHTCPKMRYKGKLVPSYLVCPETYSWVPIEKCLPLLDVNKYSRLNDDIDAIDQNFPNEDDISQMKIIYKHTLMHFDDYKLLADVEFEKYKEIGTLVGKICSREFIFWEE